MELKRVLPADRARDIAQIFLKGWQSAYQGIIPQAHLDALTPGPWEALLAQGRMDTFLLEDQGVPVGVAAIGPAREAGMEGWGELMAIYLLPDYYEQGLGKALMDAAVGALHAQGFRAVYLWVLEENSRARHFYERYGFVKTGEEMEAIIGGKALTELRYRYRISPEQSVL